MKIRELIEQLKQFDPELSVVTVVGDCDEVYEAGEPYEVYIDDADEPSIIRDMPEPGIQVLAIRI